MGRRQSSFRTAFQVAALLACAPALAQPAGTLTLTDGRVALIRGAAYYTATAGVKVQNGDILGTDSKGQAQIELQDGAILNLGPGTQAMLVNAPQAGKAAAGEIAVLAGWVKFNQKRSGKGAPASYRYVTPVALLTADEGSAVLHVSSGSAEIFLETGAMKITETEKRGAAGSSRAIKAGEFVVRKGGQPAAIASRPSVEFVKSMPRHYRDNLPVLAAKLKNKAVEPRREHDVTYSEVEAWLKASAPLKKNFVRRFQSRARDGEFRGKLIENLKAHPEWDPVLFPEKYEPKEPKK